MADPSAAACQADRLVATSEETIDLKALFPDGLRYTWSVSGGRLRAKGAEAAWRLDGLAPGPYLANVKIRGRNNENAECSQVIVVKPDTRGPRVSGRSFLVRDAHESDGYGLYSYVLLGSPPTTETQDRYSQALNAYLSQISAVQDIEKLIGKNRVNITYVPTTGSENLALTSDWILKHYDYARAAVLLNSIPGAHRDGPYIVSVLKPLQPAQNVLSDYLFQDLSGVPPNLTLAWMKLFLTQAAQEKPWESSRVERVALEMRTGIGVLAIGLPDVQKSLAQWLVWRQ